MNKYTGFVPYAKGFVGAVVGACLVGLIWTAWIDHQRTTAMWAFINQAASAQAKPPVAPGK